MINTNKALLIEDDILSDVSNSNQKIKTSLGQRMNQTIKQKLAVAEIKKNKTYQHYSNERDSRDLTIRV